MGYRAHPWPSNGRTRGCQLRLTRPAVSRVDLTVPGSRYLGNTGVRGLMDFTQRLIDVRDGDPAALNHLFPLVYEELRRLAHIQLRRGSAGDTLRTTALVHEAYLKLVDGKRVQARDRAHFMALAARVMRQVLIDHFRRNQAQKRGGARFRSI